MDPSKRDTLIQWVNAINPKESIESLQDLRDGEQFIKLLTTMNFNSNTNLQSKKDRYEVIQKFIEDYYSHDLLGQIHFDRENEFDIAKMLILILSAGVQGEHQEQFMTPALSLNQRSQLEIMNILKDIVSDRPNKLKLDHLLLARNEDTFDSIDVSCLFSPEKAQTEDDSSPVPVATPVPANGELQNRSTSTSSLNEIMSPFQRINVAYSPCPSTPLHSLITSTGFSARIIQRERNLKRKAENEILEKENLIKKLTSDLNMERHLRSDIEQEITEKNKTINSKDDKIRDLKSQNRMLKQLQDELDELNTIKEQNEQLSIEAEKSKNYAEELKDMRLQNSSLKKEMEELYEELSSLKEIKSQLKLVQLNCNKYVEELQREEKRCSSLQSSLDCKQKALDDAINSRNLTEDGLNKMKEMYQDLKRENEELVAFSSANDCRRSGESMNVITEQLMDELKKELEDLKNTWITPSIHEELKIQLANVLTERDTFESKSLKLCEEILQVQSEHDLLKKNHEDLEIEFEKLQRHFQKSQRDQEKLLSNVEDLKAKENQWHQTEMKYKTDLQQLQSKMTQTQMELSSVSTELKLANAQLENDFKSSEIRRQTLVMSVSELRNEKKKLEETYEVDKAAEVERNKCLKTQLENLKMEFASKEQELLSEKETLSMERRELEQKLETERKAWENLEKKLTSQQQEIENELNETIVQLKDHLKSAEEEMLRLRGQLREKIDDYDHQVEGLKNVKFELQTRVNKLESQSNLDKQEKLHLQTEWKKSAEKAEEFEHNVGKLSEKLNRVIGEKKELQEKLSELEKKLEAAVEESGHWMDKNTSDKKLFESRIGAMEQERAEFAETSQRTLEKLSEEFQSLSDENGKLKSQLLKQADLVSDTKKELEEKLQQVKSGQEQLLELQNLHSELQEQNSQLNNNLIMVNSQLVCKESEVTDLEHKVEELSAEKDSLIKSHEEELGATRQALSQEIINLNENIENSKSTLLSIVKQVATVANPDFALDNNNDDDVYSSLDLGNLVDSIGKDLFCMAEDNSKRLADAEERSKSQATRLLELEEKIQAKLEEADSLSGSLTELSAECDQLRLIKDEQHQQLEEKKGIIRDLEEKADQMGSEKESYQVQLNDLGIECKNTKELLEEKVNCLAEMTEKSVELNGELKSVRESLCQSEATRNKLELRNQEMEKHLNEKGIQLEDSVQTISEMNSTLADKEREIENQLEIQKQLEETMVCLKEEISSNSAQIKQLESEVEQKESLLKENDSKLTNLSETLEANQCKVKELEESHVCAMAALKQEMLLEYEQKLDTIVADYENKICENYVSKSLVESQESKSQSEIKELIEKNVELERSHVRTLAELQEEHEASVNTLKNEFQAELSTQYVPVEEAQEQNKRHFLEVQQLQEKIEAYESKMEIEAKEHKASLEKVVLEFKEKIASDFIPNGLFEEHKERHLAEMAELQTRLSAEHEEKVQHLLEEQNVCIKQLKSNFEERLTADYVLQERAEEEKEELLLETRKQLELELEEKMTALQEEHKNAMALYQEQHEKLVSEKFVERSTLEKVESRLNEKEKELSQQRAEFDLIVATLENVKEQHEASVRASECSVAEMQEKLEEQEAHINCLEEQFVNEKFDNDRHTNEIKRSYEEKLSEMKKQLDVSQKDLSAANATYQTEKVELENKMAQLESCRQAEMRELNEKSKREIQFLKEDYQRKIMEQEMTSKTEIDQLKDYHLKEMNVLQSKYKEIEENLLNVQAESKKEVCLKEEEMKEILTETKNHLGKEKSILEEKLLEMKSQVMKLKEDHEFVLKENADKMLALNVQINQLKDECRMSQNKCDKVERQLLEREQNLIKDNMKTLAKAEEMNKSLNNQILICQKEANFSQKKIQATQKEVDSLNNELKLIKEMKQKVVNELQENKIYSMKLKENYSHDKNKLEKTIKEFEQKFSEKESEIENLTKLVKHYKLRESKVSKLFDQSELDKKNFEKLTQKLSLLEQEKNSFSEYLKQEKEKSKILDKENQELNQKVLSLNEQLEKAGNALFNSSFNELDLPDDSLESPNIEEITRKTHELRSKTNTWNRMKVEDFNISPISYQSRASISSCKSIASNASNASKTSLPPGCGKFFSCEDEPATFDWGRITEIRRRNTMVPAHLRSTYPAELQNVPNSLNEEITIPKRPGSGKRKRKSPVAHSKTLQPNKEVKDRPGTPCRLRRLRHRTNINDENSPQSDKKRLRITRTPQQKPEYTGRPSLAFEISNTPKLSKRRQKGRSNVFQLPDLKREPLKQRNCRQTNL